MSHVTCDLSPITDHRSPITGYVLAGGQSSRMGRDKAWLPMGSHTLIEAVIERMRPTVDRVVVIGNGSNATRLRTLPAVEVIVDVAPGCGPLMGVFTGLMHTATPLNVFVSCDMPWIEGRLIEQLLAVCRGKTEIVAGRHPDDGPKRDHQGRRGVPELAGFRLQPFPLICHTKAGRIIGALLNAGERALQALLRQPQASVVTVEDPALWRSFTNVNTDDDYARLSDDPFDVAQGHGERVKRVEP